MAEMKTNAAVDLYRALARKQLELELLARELSRAINTLRADELRAYYEMTKDIDRVADELESAFEDRELQRSSQRQMLSRLSRAGLDKEFHEVVR